MQGTPCRGSREPSFLPPSLSQGHLPSVCVSPLPALIRTLVIGGRPTLIQDNLNPYDVQRPDFQIRSILRVRVGACSSAPRTLGLGPASLPLAVLSQHHGLVAVSGTCILLISGPVLMLLLCQDPQALPWPLRPAWPSSCPVPVTTAPAPTGHLLLEHCHPWDPVTPLFVSFFTACLPAQRKPPVSHQPYLVCPSPAGPRGPATLSRCGRDEGRMSVKPSARKVPYRSHNC